MPVKKEKLIQLVNNFKGKKALIVGDVMLDKYIVGSVSRISPEAPVQIVSVNKENYVPGGAANVASNIAALGGKAKVIGIIGNDIAAELLKNELKKRNIQPSFVVSKDKPTIQKIRVIGHSQQLLRIDYEIPEVLNKEIEDKVIRQIEEKSKDVNVIVVSDYAKGIITKNIMKKIIGLCKEKKIPVMVDPKPVNKDLYKGVTLITPNHKEANQMCGCADEKNDESLIIVGTRLAKELEASVLITRGEKGMSLFEMKNRKIGMIYHMPTKAREVYDVTGAGDTVIGTLSIALASGASIKEAMILANHAAGIVVAKVGTATCSAEELKNKLEKSL